MKNPGTVRKSSDFVGACRRHGVKATHQRVAILEEVFATDEHPDAEAIYMRVRRRVPTVSLDTVYRTLRLMEDRGVIARVGSTSNKARFDANTNRHHHFVCTDCGLIGDFYNEKFDRFAAPPEVAAMGSVESVYVEMRGRCRKCQRKRKSGMKRAGQAQGR